MKEINSIALDKRDYENDNDFWKSVALLMRELTKAKYTVSIRYEDCDIYVIEYDYTNEEWRSFIPWIDAEEYVKAMDALYAAEAQK